MPPRWTRPLENLEKIEHLSGVNMNIGKVVQIIGPVVDVAFD